MDIIGINGLSLARRRVPAAAVLQMRESACDSRLDIRVRSGYVMPGRTGQADGLSGRDAMPGSSAGRLLIVSEAEYIDPKVTIQHQYRTMRCTTRMSPVTDRM